MEGPAELPAGNLRPTGTPPVLFLAVTFRLVGTSSTSDSSKLGEAFRFLVVLVWAISFALAYIDPCKEKRKGGGCRVGEVSGGEGGGERGWARWERIFDTHKDPERGEG